MIRTTIIILGLVLVAWPVLFLFGPATTSYGPAVYGSLVPWVLRLASLVLGLTMVAQGVVWCAAAEQAGGGE